MILGTVPYLNVQPIIWALESGRIDRPDITLQPAVPRELASRLAQGQYDTAIVPVFEFLSRPGAYTYLQAPVIAARGPVYSVMLFASEPMARLRRIYLDASSFTSVHLFQVLASEMDYNFEYVDTALHPVPYPLPPETGWVVIGDPAIAEHGRHPVAVDLAVAWQELTGLPFVFAAWLVPGGHHPPGMAELLSESLEIGLKNLEQVAQETGPRFGVGPEFALRYFKDNIHYHLGHEELAGWKEFARLSHKHGLISAMPEFRPYTEN